MKFLIFLSEAMVPLMIFYIVGFGLLSGRPVLDDLRLFFPATRQLRNFALRVRKSIGIHTGML